MASKTLKCNNPNCKSNTEDKPLVPIETYGDQNRVNGRMQSETILTCNHCYWILGTAVRS